MAGRRADIPHSHIVTKNLASQQGVSLSGTTGEILEAGNTIIDRGLQGAAVAEAAIGSSAFTQTAKDLLGKAGSVLTPITTTFGAVEAYEKDGIVGAGVKLAAGQASQLAVKAVGFGAEAGTAAAEATGAVAAAGAVGTLAATAGVVLVAGAAVEGAYKAFKAEEGKKYDALMDSLPSDSSKITNSDLKALVDGKHQVDTLTNEYHVAVESGSPDRMRKALDTVNKATETMVANYQAISKDPQRLGALTTEADKITGKAPPASQQPVQAPAQVAPPPLAKLVDPDIIAKLTGHTQAPAPEPTLHAPPLPTPGAARQAALAKAPQSQGING